MIGGATEYEGRVEFYYNGQWGTVCDDSWDINDARVVCRQLHFTGANAALRVAPFGAGTGPIWLDNLLCTGTEQGLNECPHNGFGTHDCSHSEDAGVRCTGTWFFLSSLNATSAHSYGLFVLHIVKIKIATECIEGCHIYLLQHLRILMFDCVMGLHNMKVVLMSVMRDNGVPSVTMAGTSMTLWSSVDSWDTHPP